MYEFVVTIHLFYWTAAVTLADVSHLEQMVLLLLKQLRGQTCPGCRRPRWCVSVRAGGGQPTILCAALTVLSVSSSDRMSSVSLSFIYELFQKAHLTYDTKTFVYEALEQISGYLAGRQYDSVTSPP